MMPNKALWKKKWLWGCLAIVSAVGNGYVEIIQQNPGPFGASRETYILTQQDGAGWRIGHERIVGFLRLPSMGSA